MDRRKFLTAAAGGLVVGAGCIGTPGGDDDESGGAGSPTDGDGGNDVETTFELTDAELTPDEPPVVAVADDTVTARGTVRYGSSSCGTVRLAHAGYERSQDRLDLLVVAADASGDAGACTDDLVETGYRAEATVPGRLRRVAATEHHAFGATYSTTVEPDG